MEKDVINKYKRIISWSEKDGFYIVEIPELPGCMAEGKTILEAIENTEIIIKEWIKAAMANGRSIPLPESVQEKDCLDSVNAPYMYDGEKKINISKMSEVAIKLMEILPKNEQKSVLESLKKLVLTWDADYTNVTDRERAELDEAMQDFKNGETISHNDINWD